MTDTPDDVSFLRQMQAETSGGMYKSCASLDEARALSSYVVVMEGDYGGQIYAVCPVDHIKCDEATLRQLLLDIDDTQWGDPEGSQMCYEQASPVSRIAGGMGGGKVIDSVWCHKNLHEIHMVQAVSDVIEGRTNRLTPPPLDELEKLAEGGNRDLQFFLARQLQTNSPLQAAKWFREAAFNGHFSSMCWITQLPHIENKERALWEQVKNATMSNHELSKQTALSELREMLQQ